MALTLLRPDLDPGRRFVSEFARGPHGWIMTGAFALTGLGLLLLASGLHRAMHGIPARSAGAVLLAFGGCSLLLLSIFPVDLQGTPATTMGKVHSLVALLGFLSINVSFLVYVRAFRHGESWKGLYPWATGVGVASLIAFAGYVSLMGSAWLVESDLPNRLQGAGQRLAISWSLAWIVLASVRMRTAPKLAPPMASEACAPAPSAEDGDDSGDAIYLWTPAQRAGFGGFGTEPETPYNAT